MLDLMQLRSETAMPDAVPGRLKGPDWLLEGQAGDQLSFEVGDHSLQALNQ